MHLNLLQLAESFGVPEKVVMDWVQHEELPHATVRGRLVFRRDKVAAWAQARGIGVRAGFLVEDPVPLRDAAGVATLLRVGGVWRDVSAAEARATLARIVATLPGVNASIRQLLGQRMQAPDGLVWAPAGHGFALPHLKARVALGRDAGVVALLLLRDALPLDEATPDGEPVRRLLFFMAPTPRAHLDLLAQLARLSRHAPFQQALEHGADDEAVFRAAAPTAQRKPAAGAGCRCV
ncbi:MAG: PTS sugar transporter subunit IIA [Verrucomicrobiales bacterium]|nr:PTS sugar transporter subunit IIA [Verrucomicrobiales bacterium]